MPHGRLGAMSDVLSAEELEERLKKLPEWELVSGAIERTSDLATVVEAMAVANTLADLADEANPHPHIDNRWTKVRLAPAPHSAGWITAQDTEMAQRVDRA